VDAIAVNGLDAQDFISLDDDDVTDLVQVLGGSL